MLRTHSIESDQPVIIEGDPDFAAGPLRSGTYLLFLKAATAPGVYFAVGGGQGRVDLVNGRSHVVDDIGFEDFAGRTESELVELVAAIKR